MGLRDVTAAAVEKALAEFDRLGRDRFLEKYGFGRAREYFLLHDGKKYDSKAIVGVAHGFGGRGLSPLTPRDFTGGEQTVMALLTRLGFEVVVQGAGNTGTAGGRNPPWADEELILALNLYLREGLLDDQDPLVIELSERLNDLPIHDERPDAARFRNPNGVAMKLANFAALDPASPGAGMSRHSKRDKKIWETFSHDEDALGAAAERILAGKDWSQPPASCKCPPWDHDVAPGRSTAWDLVLRSNASQRFRSRRSFVNSRGTSRPSGSTKRFI